jgi:hypothetical protein
MLLVLLAACNLSRFGAYTCDEYCDQVLNRTETCAEEAALAECEAADVPDDFDCEEYSEDQLAQYASRGRPDWAGQTRVEMLESCEADIQTSGKSDASCQAETATLNNIACEDLLTLLAQLADAGE